MAAGPSRSALTALLIVLPIGLFLAWSQPTEGPSRNELAKALHDAGRGEVRAEDLRDLDCTARASGAYACSWRQREDGAWRERRGNVAVSGQAWTVVGADTAR